MDIAGYVTINIDDPKKYLDVATLVDRADFITDLLALRKKWKIKKPYPRNNDRWKSLPPFIEQVPKNTDILKKVNEAEQSLQFMKDMYVLKDKPDDDLRHKEEVMRRFRRKASWKRFPSLYFEYDVMKLRKKFKKSPNFDQIVVCAALYASIHASDYKTCEIGLSFQGDALWQPFHEPQPTINFYPLVTTDEIVELFKKEGKGVLEKYQTAYLKGKVFNPDTVSNVARDRKWYWWKKQGLSYGQILTKAEDEGEVLSRDAVIKAIKRYTRLVTVDI